MTEHASPRDDAQVSLVELVNRVVDRGVVLSGEITISVADVDLLLVGLRLLLSSVDRLERPAENDPPPRVLPAGSEEGIP